VFLGTNKKIDGKLSFIPMVKKLNIVLKMNWMLSEQGIEFIKKWEFFKQKKRHQIIKEFIGTQQVENGTLNCTQKMEVQSAVAVLVMNRMQQKE
jgi:hypothetical protein